MTSPRPRPGSSGRSLGSRNKKPDNEDCNSTNAGAPNKPDLKNPSTRRNPDGTAKNPADQVDEIKKAQAANRKEGGDGIHSTEKSEQKLKNALDNYDPEDWK